MKVYLIVLAALFCLSSCIKVEEIPLCTNPPAAPLLASYNITAASDSSLTLSVLSPDPSLVYQWDDANGYYHFGPTIQLNYPVYGNWSVLAQKGSSCAGDSAKFTVSPVQVGCNLGIDSFQQTSLLPVKCSFTPSQNSPYNGYYMMTFLIPSGNILIAYFPSQPAASAAYYVSDYSYAGLSYDQCYLLYEASDGSTEVGFNSSVNVSVNGTAITLTFCDVQFIYPNSYTNSFVCSGHLVGS